MENINFRHPTECRWRGQASRDRNDRQRRYGPEFPIDGRRMTAKFPPLAHDSQLAEVNLVEICIALIFDIGS
jgi:hypothetical protein